MLNSNSSGFNFLIFCLIEIVLIKGNVFAQLSTDSHSKPVSPRYSKLTFSQDLNIFEWLYSFNYYKLSSKGMEFNIKEEYRSTLQSITSNDRWKDFQNFTFSVSYPVLMKLSLNANIYSHILSDPLAGFDNDVIYHSGKAKVIYQPQSNISISPYISTKLQTQLEKRDQAISYGFDAHFMNLKYLGYENALTIMSERDVFPQRINEDFKIRYKIERQFYNSTADTLIVFFDRIRRDSFDADTTGIYVRSLSQSYRGIENNLSYGVGSATVLFLKNSFSMSSFKVNNLKEKENSLNKHDVGFESKNNVNIVIHKPGWFSDIGWSYRTRSRDDRRPPEVNINPFDTRHPSLGFNTDEVFVNFGIRGGVSVSRKDSVGIHSSVSKFQYETSDTTNPNDHDQIRWQFTISHAHHFNSDLRLIVQGSVFLNHFVYISSQYSSGNNWERIFQLAPLVIYQPSERFKFRQSFKVRAKYQTYDFDDPNTSNRNTVNRQFILSNVSQYNFSYKSSLELGFNFELAEQGKLFYKLWRQQLALSWRSQELQLIYRHQVGSYLVLAGGAKIFHQIRWSHKMDSKGDFGKNVKDKHTNIGPMLDISYRPSKHLEFVFLGNIQVVNSSGRETDLINNFDVNLNLFF